MCDASSAKLGAPPPIVPTCKLGGVTKPLTLPFSLAITGDTAKMNATVDVNRPLSDRLAVRFAAVWADADGWRERQFSETKAAFLTATVKLGRNTSIRIEGEYGRRKYADVRAFAERTTMTLIGVSHAASEQLVLRTQLSRWLTERHGLTPHLLDEPQWWR